MIRRVIATIILIAASLTGCEGLLDNDGCDWNEESRTTTITHSNGETTEIVTCVPR